MGTAASKTAQKGPRKFPSRAPGAGPPPPRPSRGMPSQSSLPKASYAKDDAVRVDSMDPDMSAAFSERLKQMGIAQPNPTFSPSSTAAPSLSKAQPMPMPSPRYPSSSSNTTLSVLEARRKLQDQADEEFDNMGRSTDQGREFLDVSTIRDILVLRDRGADATSIESQLRLKPGVVNRLGPRGLVAAAGAATP